MREYQASSEFTINEEIWDVRVEYDEYPDLDNGSHIAYVTVMGPNGMTFEYEFHFTKHIMRNHKYLLSDTDDRVKHAILKTKSFIKREYFKNLLVTISPKGTDIQPAD
ncbi:hypothetical protein ACFL6E_07105 [Candidatus Neomarinimicrobiota bacterium]